MIIIPIEVNVEGIVIVVKDVGPRCISNIRSPKIVKPFIKMIWEREEQRLKAAVPKIIIIIIIIIIIAITIIPILVIVEGIVIVAKDVGPT